MKEIGAFEAKTRLGQLLDQVEAGEDILITRRGKPVARLSPPGSTYDRERALAAVARIKARRQGLTLGGLKILETLSFDDPVNPVYFGSCALVAEPWPPLAWGRADRAA